MEPNQEKSTASASNRQGLARRLASAREGEDFDCWNQIGVSGDGSCPELVQFVHCRNCPVFSAAAARLLDREATVEYRHNWSEHFARETKPALAGKKSIIIFGLGAELLALPTRNFQEVAEQRPVHSIPHRRDGILLGLVNVRGELLPCISLGRLLGIASVERPKSGRVLERLLVAEWQGERMAFPVDEVHGAHRYHTDELQQPPATIARAEVNFTRGVLPWQNRLVGCLNEEMLFPVLNRSLS